MRRVRAGARRRARGAPVAPAGADGILPGVSDDTRSQPGRPGRDTASVPDRAAGSAGPQAQKGVQGEDGEKGALGQARADLAAGREWRARERLVAHLAETYDPEALELLGEVQYAMRDLPAAGAAWFGTARRGEDVDAAVDAWREQYSDHFPAMWLSLPAPVREHEGNKRVDALRRRAAAVPAPGAQAPAAAEEGSGGFDAAVVVALVLAGLFVVCAVVGFVTVLRWLVP